MMGNVLKMDKKQVIIGLIKMGQSDRAIHKATGIHRTTIARYRKAVQSVPQVPADVTSVKCQSVPPVPTDQISTNDNNKQDFPLPSTQSQSIISHRECIRSSVLSGLTAQRIYQELVEHHSYLGSYDSVKRYVRKFKKRHQPYFDRLPTFPGHEAQVDFAKSPCKVLINGKYRSIWFFKMTLSHSRHSYEELVLRQDTETFLRCHENAFHAFDGVPETIKLDNLKAGVIQACIYDPVINPVYQAFAEHWGFIPNPCAPAMPNHKGRVERDVQYTESNALQGQQFESIDDGNSYLRQWNKRWARTRIHGTTKCQVWKMFVDTEQQKLKPLASCKFALFTVCIRKVDITGLVEVGCNFYSAPARYIGDYVVIHHNSTDVKIYSKEEPHEPAKLLVRHYTLQGKGKCSQTADCKPTWKHPDLEAQEMYYCRKARLIGQCCYTLIYRILSTDAPLAIRRVRGILSLQHKFDNKTVEYASSIALYQQRYNYNTIKSLCTMFSEKGDSLQQQSLALTQEHDALRPLDEYQLHIEERTR